MTMSIILIVSEVQICDLTGYFDGVFKKQNCLSMSE